MVTAIAGMLEYRPALDADLIARLVEIRRSEKLAPPAGIAPREARKPAQTRADLAQLRTVARLGLEPVEPLPQPQLDIRAHAIDLGHELAERGTRTRRTGRRPGAISSSPAASSRRQFPCRPDTSASVRVSSVDSG